MEVEERQGEGAEEGQGEGAKEEPVEEPGQVE